MPGRKVAYVFNSVSKAVNESSGDYKVLMGRGVRRVSELYIELIAIPHTFYNITTANNTLIVELKTPVTVTVSVGNYTEVTLATELQAKMLAAGILGSTVTYNAATFKYTIATSGPFNVSIASTLLPVLGITTPPLAPASSITGNIAANLSTVQYITLSSGLLCKGFHDRTTYYDDTYNLVLCVIPVVVVDGWIIYEPKESLVFKSTTSFYGTDAVDLTLSDQSNNILDLNGRDWYMHMSFVKYDEA
jgi:hypothetical protein